MQNIKTSIAISAQGVKKDFLEGRVQALRGVDLEVKKGEWVIIFGPSGCGKSTLLGLMAGFEEPTNGKVYIDSIDVNRLRPDQAAHLRHDKIGMVFQQYNLVPALSAQDNVALPLILAGVSRRTARRRAADVLQNVGLTNRSYHKPAQMSGGEQQRVAVARALVEEPEILLLDEPTGNLDEANSNEILRLLEQIRNKGTTLVMVTHNPDYLKQADRVYQMHDGQIIKQIVNRKTAEIQAEDESKIPSSKQLRGHLGFSETIRLVTAHLRNKPYRTFFAILGVSLGVGTIVGLVSLGIGMQAIATEQIASFNGLITISVTETENSANPLNDEAVQKIGDIKHVKMASPNITAPAQVTYDNTSTTLVATGLNKDALDFEGVKLATGDASGAVMTRAAIKNFSIKNDSDIIGKPITIVLVQASDADSGGSAQSLLNSLKPKQLDITVTGVSDDELLGTVYIPLDKIKSAVNFKSYTSVNAQIDSRKNVASARDEIEKLGYTTKSVVDLIDQVDRVFLISEIILGIIGGVALIVALLGVVNIMTIALLERTHEIGILKSLGATNKDVKKIFSTEASLFGLIGGSIGVMLAWLAGLGINKLLNWMIQSSGGGESATLFIVPIGFAIVMIFISYFVAIIAGWYPARHAGKLSAMEALRYE